MANNQLTRIAGSSNSKVTKTIQKKLVTPKFKLTKFDKELLKSIVNGNDKIEGLLAEFSISKNELVSRIDELVKVDLLSMENEHIKLTIKTYNTFRIKKSVKNNLQNRNTTSTIDNEQLQIKEKVIENQEKPKQISIDLNELLRRGAPTKNPNDNLMQSVQNVEKKESQSHNINEESNRESQKSSEIKQTETSELCQLCKETFKLSMTDSRPKYGHCFCGAAYHKDCYEGILVADGKCIRCGRKLELELQKETKDELKKIRGMFED